MSLLEREGARPVLLLLLRVNKKLLRDPSGGNSKGLCVCRVGREKGTRRSEEGREGGQEKKGRRQSF